MSQERYDQLVNSKRGLITGTMRDVLLPAILGDETDGIMYWIGKDLARQYPVANDEDLVTIFKQLGMGDLKLVKQSDTQHIFQLYGPIVEERLAIQKEQTSFTLEAGFLTQELEFRLQTVTEAEVSERRHKFVQILAQNDPQTLTDSEGSEMIKFIHLHQPGEQIAKEPRRRNKKQAKN